METTNEVVVQGVLMKHSIATVSRFGGALVIISIVMSLTACAPKPPGPALMNTQSLTINFNGNGCATSVSDGDPYVSKTAKIQWAASSNGNHFRIWFMPFKSGRVLDSVNGKLGPLEFDAGTPSGTPLNPIPNRPGVAYKYTVQSLDSEGGSPKANCKPLDPHIRIG